MIDITEHERYCGLFHNRTARVPIKALVGNPLDCHLFHKTTQVMAASQRPAYLVGEAGGGGLSVACPASGAAQFKTEPRRGVRLAGPKRFLSQSKAGLRIYSNRLVSSIDATEYRFELLGPQPSEHALLNCDDWFHNGVQIESLVYSRPWL